MAAHRGPQQGAAGRWPCNFMVQLVMQDQLVTGHYRGGEYIDLFIGRYTTGAAVAVINVYDYEAGKPRIEYTRAEVSREMREWRSELYPHEIAEYIRNS